MLAAVRGGSGANHGDHRGRAEWQLQLERGRRARERVWLEQRVPKFPPPISGPPDLGLTRVPAPSANLKSCWLQTEPAHTLPWLQGIPILIATGEASYHSTYDYCTSKFLTQVGVTNDWVYLPTVGIHGNGHMQMLEMNNLEIARFYERWLSERLSGSESPE